MVPEGLTTVLLAIMLFGSLSVFGTGLLGEYLAKVFEEVKQRPLYIRRSVIRDGEIRAASDDHVQRRRSNVFGHGLTAILRPRNGLPDDHWGELFARSAITV